MTTTAPGKAVAMCSGSSGGVRVGMPGKSAGFHKGETVCFVEELPRDTDTDAHGITSMTALHDARVRAQTRAETLYWERTEGLGARQSKAPGSPAAPQERRVCCGPARGPSSPRRTEVTVCRSRATPNGGFSSRSSFSVRPLARGRYPATAAAVDPAARAFAVTIEALAEETIALIARTTQTAADRDQAYREAVQGLAELGDSAAA